ncbi:uncharacterized protein LOC134719779 isoform X2 [Mytilus trossulus]|uniref:uncharacterized protein LOC134719779 isoform X2 n=1 Tax=Mytilus trossulus TaxID=6551 RepID=UPI00300413DD
MLRLALILSVLYLVAQVYGQRGGNPRRPGRRFGLLKRFYDMVLQEREVQKCWGISESFLDCAVEQGCENEACPENMYCCSTDKCGNMCLCKSTPDGCNKYCVNGYVNGANGCPTCACRKKSQNEQDKREPPMRYNGPQVRREEEELKNRKFGFGKYARQVGRD